MTEQTFTRTQRILRPIINKLVERWFPRHCFYGHAYLDCFKQFDKEDRQIAKTAAMYLASILRDQDATNIAVTIEGYSSGEELHGDYRLSLQKLTAGVRAEGE